MSDFPQLQRLVEAADKLTETPLQLDDYKHSIESYSAGQGFINAAVDALPELRLLLSQRRACEELLKSAKCPNCDGSGTVVYTQDAAGHYADIGPCQWCDERAAILQQEQPK